MFDVGGVIIGLYVLRAYNNNAIEQLSPFLECFERNIWFVFNKPRRNFFQSNVVGFMRTLDTIELDTFF